MTALDDEPIHVVRVRPLLSFTDQAYELRFVQYYNDFYYRYAQFSLGLGLVLVFADFLVDLLAFPDDRANIYRVQLCLPILGFGIGSSFTGYARRHWQPVMASFIVVVALSLFWVLIVIDRQGGMGLRSWVGILNFIFLEFYCFVILGVQFRYAFISGVAILLAFASDVADVWHGLENFQLLVLSRRPCSCWPSSSAGGVSSHCVRIFRRRRRSRRRGKPLST